MTNIAQEEFGTRVRKRLIDLHLSITHLAKKMRCNRNSIHLAISNPSKVPNFSRRLAKRLDISPHE